MCMVYMCDNLCVRVFNLVVKIIRKYQQKTHEGRDVHADVRLVFLDGFKGTDRVPVEAVPREGRRVFARTLERDAEGEYRVEALDEPQGVERDDLGRRSLSPCSSRSSANANREPPTFSCRRRPGFVWTAPSTRSSNSTRADGGSSAGTCSRRKRPTLTTPSDGCFAATDPRVSTTRGWQPCCATSRSQIACGDMRMRSYSPSVADASAALLGGDGVEGGGRGTR